MPCFITHLISTLLSSEQCRLNWVYCIIFDLLIACLLCFTVQWLRELILYATFCEQRTFKNQPVVANITIAQWQFLYHFAVH